MSFEYANNLRVSVFGQSHSRYMGVVIEGLPCGFAPDEEELNGFLARRKAADALATARRESDEVKFAAGLFEGKTCGSPLVAVIENKDARSEDYASLAGVPRPSHADYTAGVKYGGYGDYRGGGHFSGRLTAPLCVAGGLAKQLLAAHGVTVGAHLYETAGVRDAAYDPVKLCAHDLEARAFPVLDAAAGAKMKKKILAAKAAGDSVGGIIETGVIGLPAGLGDPNFDGAENIISRLAFAVPAVKGIEFGNGFAAAGLYGSDNNDEFCLKDGKVATKTNNSGGINGGITNGMPVIFRTAMKPTPSINKIQRTLDLKSGGEVELVVGGRHDPCVAVRAVPAMESVAAIAFLDMMLGAKKI